MFTRQVGSLFVLLIFIDKFIEKNNTIIRMIEKIELWD